MLILVVSQRLPYPPNKGEKIRTYNQIKALARKGIEVQVFCPIESDCERIFATEMESKLGVTVNTFKVKFKGFRLVKGLLKGTSFSQANFFSSDLRDELMRQVQLSHVDAIIASASSLWPYLENAKKVNSKECLYLVDLMDVDSDKWLQYADNSRGPMKTFYLRESRLIRKLERQISRKSDGCYLIAKAEVEVFKRVVDGQSKVKVLGNGIDTGEFYPPIKKVKSPIFTLLFTGVMDYKPNVDAVTWFIDNCWQGLRKKIPEAKFIIAGMNPTTEVKAFGRVAGIEVTGKVDDILPYFHSADVFVAPFRIARGVQNKVLQAFSCSLPVVSTTMGAEGIACSNQKNIMIADDKSKFLTSILDLHKSENLRFEVGRAAHQLIKNKYSWKSQIRPLLDDLEITQE